MTTEDIIMIGIFLFLGFILIPACQSACSRYHNPYGKYKVYKNMNGKYFAKYVTFYAYGIIPVWCIYKTREDTVSPYQVREFNTEIKAHEMMDKYHKAYIQMKNAKKVKR